MAFTKASLAPLMAVLIAVFALLGAVQAQEAPAPSPASGAGLISPSFGAALVAAIVALLFGSALKI